MNHARHNAQLEAVVNRGLAAALLLDLESGIRIMSSGGVPRPVITRVFLEPQLRRATDWKR
ncbi:MAG: hypothetical protein ABI478_13180 [Propionivibrio sp.]